MSHVSCPLSTLERWTTGKRLIWASIAVLVGWTLVPTVLSFFWSFQDHFQDWASARNFWEGIPVYSPHSETVYRYLGEDFAHLPDGKLFPIVATVKVNAHPPSSILFFLPFGLLPYSLSYFAWNLLSAACIGLAAVILIRELDLKLSPRAFVLIAVLGFTGGPIFEQMVFGQTNAITLAFLALAWRAHRRGWQGREGCWLGAAAAMKLFPLVLFVVPFGARRWRSLATASGTALLLMTLPLALFGSDCWSQFRSTGMLEAVAWSDLWPNVSLSGFWKKLFVSQNLGHAVPFPSLTAYWVGYSVSCVLLGLATSWLIVVRHRTVGGDRSYAIAVCAMLLLSPTCWPHYFLMLLVPLAVLWHEHRDCVARRRVIALGFALLFAPGGLYVVLFAGNPVVGPALALTGLAAQTYVLLGVWSLAAKGSLLDRFTQRGIADTHATTWSKAA